MKVFILSCILVGLLVHSATSTRCVCKCCTTDGCDTSTAPPEAFDLTDFCNSLTCNRGTCAANFKDCPWPATAGNVDSSCSEPSMAPLVTSIPVVTFPGTAGHVDSSCSEVSMAPIVTQIPIVTLSAVLIGTFMKWCLY